MHHGAAAGFIALGIVRDEQDIHIVAGRDQQLAAGVIGVAVVGVVLRAGADAVIHLQETAVLLVADVQASGHDVVQGSGDG